MTRCQAFFSCEKMPISIGCIIIVAFGIAVLESCLLSGGGGEQCLELPELELLCPAADSAPELDF